MAKLTLSPNKKEDIRLGPYHPIDEITIYAL